MDDNNIKRGPGRPRKEPPVPPSEPEQKRGRGRPPLSPEEKKRRAEERALNPVPATSGFAALKNMEPGDNSRYLNHALAVMNMPPIDKADPVQVERRIQEYFVLCAENDMKPTVKGFCNAIGITRQTLFDWKHGNFRANSHQEIILKAYGLLEELWESYLQNGKMNPIAAIFLGKNNFGYQDKQEYVVTPNAGVQETVDVATIEAKYAELPEIED